MKRFSPIGLFLLVLGACAPAQPAAGPTPAAPPTAPATPPEPDEALAASPANWWLLDLETDRLRGISAQRSYTELLAGREPKRSVVVAIIDSGVDVEHEDLDDNLWTNKGEIPGNGRDDDRNGYVDDIHGWNFIGGRDGRNVEHDTYEVTRLYADLRGRCGGSGASSRAECAQFSQIQAEFKADSAEAAEQYAQYQTIRAAVQRATAILKAQVGTDSLTAERVAAIRSIRPDVLQAKQIYMQLAANDVTPAQIDEAVEHFESQVRYGYNPTFNPRPIVGDRYADPNDRSYGNNNVKGPDASHGTHVAGIAAAERANNVGIDGIAPPNTQLMVIRAVPDGDERDKDVANAIRYAVDNGAQIINMSFGKAYSPQKRLVDEAVRYADTKGVLLVHAAGNDAEDIDTKPNFPNRHYEGGGTAQRWIEVGASSRALDSLAAPFSNYGRQRVDVFAPGVGILSTVPGNDYKANQGTSMAAPVVSGLAALLMAYYPELSAADVKQIILESATRYTDQAVARPGEKAGRVPFGQLSATGGIVNAYAAIQMAEQRSGTARQ